MRSFFITLALVLPIAAVVTVAACSSSDDTATNTGTGACTKDGDCSGGKKCGYDVSKGCSAAGQCVTPSDLPFKGCGCDGQPVAYVGGGYTVSPVSSSLPCKDASVEDSGPNGEDAGPDAADDASDGAVTSEAGPDGGSDGSTDAGDASDGASE